MTTPHKGPPVLQGVQKETAKDKRKRINSVARAQTKELSRLTAAYKQSVEAMQTKLKQLMDCKGNTHAHIVWHDTYNSGGGSNELSVGGERAKNMSQEDIKLLKIVLNLVFHHDPNVRQKVMMVMQVSLHITIMHHMHRMHIALVLLVYQLHELHV